jgi:hypothetical protein
MTNNLRLRIEPFSVPGAEPMNELSANEQKLVSAKIAANQRAPSSLADAVFYLRHPELHGRRIMTNETALTNEWKAILRDVSKPIPAPVAPPTPQPAFVWPTHPLPAAASSRFASALAKLEARVITGDDPRSWRYLCWIAMLRDPQTDDRLIRWSRICPATSGAIGAAFMVGGCDITMGTPVKQDVIEKTIQSVSDVDAKGESIGIITYLRSDIVVSEEMTSQPLESLRMLHDDVQRTVGNFGKWEDAPLGGSSAMPPAYRAIKEWIRQHQDDKNSLYSCL